MTQTNAKTGAKKRPVRPGGFGTDDKESEGEEDAGDVSDVERESIASNDTRFVAATKRANLLTKEKRAPYWVVWNPIKKNYDGAADCSGDGRRLRRKNRSAATPLTTAPVPAKTL